MVPSDVCCPLDDTVGLCDDLLCHCAIGAISASSRETPNLVYGVLLHSPDCHVYPIILGSCIVSERRVMCRLRSLRMHSGLKGHALTQAEINGMI